MISLKTLTNKVSFSKSKDEKLIDLTRSSISYVNEPRVATRILVTEEFEMRPDLIALSVYGDDSMADYILKYNGISNPLSIEKGQYLLIPDQDEMEQSFIIPASDDNDYATKEVKNVEVTTKKRDKKSSSLRKSILETKKQNESLPPNIKPEGTDNVVVKDGKIIFAPTNVPNLANCPNSQSRARVKEKFLKINIFGK